MSGSGNNWEDRRGMFQTGKPVHEPGRKLSGAGASLINGVRRASVSSQTSNSGLDKTPSNNGSQPSSPTDRRRSSNSGALFGNLMTHKRGSEGYEQRRQSHAEMQGQGGLMSGWFNSTFRGMQQAKPEMKQPEAPKMGEQQKRGVME